MELRQFTYAKPNGNISPREVIITSKPSTNFAGYDVTSLPDLDFANMVSELNALQDKHKTELLLLMQKYDLTQSYRQFVPDRMTNMTVEHV